MDWVARRRWPAALVLLGLCAFLFFYGLTAGDLYRTENLRAIIAADFLRSGNWVIPKLYGEPLFTKPPGMYAAIALVSWPFGGVSTWTARLPSALAATLTVFLVYWYFGRQLGRLGGLLAAALLPASILWLDKVPTAEIDALQVTWVTAAIVFFLRALEADEEIAKYTIHNAKGKIPGPFCLLHCVLCILQSPAFWWLAALLCVAGGFLTKWTAPAFFYGTAVPLLWWRGRLRLLWGRHHLLGAAVAAGVCLGWAGLAVGLTGWDVFYETVSREALQRLSPSHHLEALEQLSPNHQPAVYPWMAVLLHPVRTLAANLPWSAFALVALWPGFARRWDERGRRLLQALHCWAWPNLFFWSIIPEHAQRHSFPLFPAFSGLAALVWLAFLTGRLGWPLVRVRPAHVLLGLLGLWLVAKVVFVEAWVPSRNHERAPRLKGEELAALVPADRPLYVFHLKDEGIMFYYGRRHPLPGAEPPVQRRSGPDKLLSPGEPVYCILEEPEWRRWRDAATPAGDAEALLHLTDEQGDPIVLVRLVRPAGPDREETTGR
jgi:4-amino-4-deoxy-L-arabinose transferase-like glycosyltransferase